MSKNDYDTTSVATKIVAGKEKQTQLDPQCANLVGGRWSRFDGTCGEWMIRLWHKCDTYSMFSNWFGQQGAI